MQVIQEALVPLSFEELERGRAKRDPTYPPAEDRLTITKQAWDEMYTSGCITIPEGEHVAPRTPNAADPVYTPENPMPVDAAQLADWKRQGVLLGPDGEPALDTANRPLHPRAPQLLTTIGMYTGTGALRYHGPNIIGNLGLRVVRNSIVYYVTVAVDRCESRLRISLPGGHAKPGETALDAAITEFDEEAGVDIRLIGGIVLPAHVIAAPHPFWKNTLHGFTSEQYFFAQSDEDPAIEGMMLKTKDPDEVKQLGLMTVEEIRRHPDFLGSHRKQIELHEERLDDLPSHPSY